MADDNVLRVFAEEAEHIVAGLEENVNGGRVVVLPLEATHSVVSKLLEVVRTVAKVINAICGAVFSLEEGGHVGDVIAVEGLHTASRERHGEHTTSDIRNIKVELLVLKAMPLAAYNASKPIHKNNRFLFLEPLLAVYIVFLLQPDAYMVIGQDVVLNVVPDVVQGQSTFRNYNDICICPFGKMWSQMWSRIIFYMFIGIHALLKRKMS